MNLFVAARPNMKNIVIISDDVYFTHGMATVLEGFNVDEICVDSLSAFFCWRGKTSLNISLNCVIIISVRDANLAKNIVSCFFGASAPVVVFLFNMPRDYCLIRKGNLYFTAKRTSCENLKKIIKEVASGKRVGSIQFGPRQMYIMRLLMAGRSLQEVADHECISNKTVSAYKMGFLKSIQTDNIQQAHELINFILSIWHKKS